MTKWLYIPVNAWQVAGVVYANESLAIAAAQRFGQPILQLYKQLQNPEWKGKQ